MRKCTQGLSDEPLNVDLKELREEQRVIEGIHEVGGRLFEELGFDKILGTDKRGQGAREVLRDVVLARLAQPVSKLRTAGLLEEDFGIRISVDRIYRMMDRLVDRVESLKEQVARATMGLFKEKVEVLLFDVTTLWFESQGQDELRNFGFSKDKKFNEVQVVLALATTKEGLPVWYELFEGNIAETKTLIPSLSELKRRFDVENVICVADRAMLSATNLKALEESQFGYILGMRLRTMSGKDQEKILDFKNGRDLSQSFFEEILLDESRRLIIAYSPERAKKDAKDRQRQIEKLQAKLKKGKAATSSLVSNGAAKKFTSEERKGQSRIDDSKIKKDAAWDGLYGVCTNNREIKAEETIAHYKSLWNIEHTFRVTKHDLKIRPIYHWSSDRIKAHCAICFLCLALATHLEYRVSLQQRKISFAAIQEALISVQASILRDVRSKKIDRVPSKTSSDAKRIYSAFSIKRSVVPSQIQ